MVAMEVNKSHCTWKFERDELWISSVPNATAFAVREFPWSSCIARWSVKLAASFFRQIYTSFGSKSISKLKKNMNLHDNSIKITLFTCNSVRIESIDQWLINDGGIKSFLSSVEMVSLDPTFNIKNHCSDRHINIRGGESPAYST